jgi:Ohr subfamily peroxiredoxin
MSQLERVRTEGHGERLLYSARVRTIGGRDHGAARSSDGRLDVRLATPGGIGSGTNPEQLLAAGWSGCFASAIGLAAAKRRIVLPPDLAIDAQADLILTDGGYLLRARLDVSLPDVARDVAQALVDEAHATCPYSKAMRHNVAVAIHLV